MIAITSTVASGSGAHAEHLLDGLRRRAARQAEVGQRRLVDLDRVVAGDRERAPLGGQLVARRRVAALVRRSAELVVEPRGRRGWGSGRPRCPRAARPPPRACASSASRSAGSRPTSVAAAAQQLRVVEQAAEHRPHPQAAQQRRLGARGVEAGGDDRAAGGLGGERARRTGAGRSASRTCAAGRARPRRAWRPRPARASARSCAAASAAGRRSTSAAADGSARPRRRTGRRDR